MANDDTIRIFIGYDTREAVAFSVLSHSIHARSSIPVSITPIMLSQLGGVFHRERDPLQSTDFSFSRFLTPYLAGYEGWAVFMDCDMLMLDDPAKLWALRDDDFAVMCVKHNHVPTEETKFLGEKQTKYAYKNWSSVMMFNCAKCGALTPDFVNDATGLQLHQFKWLESDDLIGEIPRRWNHLVGVSEPLDDPALLHYTIGGPYFEQYKDCDYSAEWFRERDGMLYALGADDAEADKSVAAE
jgi:hypothetical protein